MLSDVCDPLTEIAQQTPWATVTVIVTFIVCATWIVIRFISRP